VGGLDFWGSSRYPLARRSWGRHEKVQENRKCSFEEISKKKNFEVYFFNIYYKFASLEIPVESYVVEYTI
jgi:hypothetical protein